MKDFNFSGCRAERWRLGRQHSEAADLPVRERPPGTWIPELGLVDGVVDDIDQALFVKSHSLSEVICDAALWVLHPIRKVCRL